MLEWERWEGTMKKHNYVITSILTQAFYIHLNLMSQKIDQGGIPIKYFTAYMFVNILLGLHSIQSIDIERNIFLVGFLNHNAIDENDRGTESWSFCLIERRAN
jgi:hypothetical protein